MPSNCTLSAMRRRCGSLWRSHWLRLSLMALVLAVSFGASASAQRGYFKGLGDLLGGEQMSVAHAVSADGSVVVGRSHSAKGDEAFRWTKETGMVGLGDLPGGRFFSEADAVSANGSVIVGGGVSAKGAEGFRWTVKTGIVGVGDLPGGQFWSFVNDLSADGSVMVGFSESAKGVEAFRWTEKTGMVGLGDLPGGKFESSASAVSADGSVVVGRSDSAKGTEAFRWTEKTGMVGLGDLPGGKFESSAHAVSADGSVVVGEGFSSKGNQAFRWTEKTGMVGLGYLRRSLFEWGKVCESVAYAVSADGSVVVGYSQCGDDLSGMGHQMIIGDKEAFIWHEHVGMLSVRDWLRSHGVKVPAGWQLEAATDVVVNGSQVTVVGWGRNPDGKSEAWIASAPIPTGFSYSAQILLSVCPFLVFVGGMVLLFRRWRRTQE